MDDTPRAALRVALLAQDCQRGEFRALLENEGIEVVLDGCLDFPLPQSWNGAEVLLVDMDGAPKRHEVESVLRQVPVPVLLNAGGIGGSSIWHRRLVGKLQTLAERERTRVPISTRHRQRPDLQLVQEGSSCRWRVDVAGGAGGIDRRSEGNCAFSSGVAAWSARRISGGPAYFRAFSGFAG